jgi:hypothetical protein
LAKASASLDGELALRERLAIRLHLDVSIAGVSPAVTALVQAMSLRGRAEPETLPQELLDHHDSLARALPIQILRRRSHVEATRAHHAIGRPS